MKRDAAIALCLALLLAAAATQAEEYRNRDRVYPPRVSALIFDHGRHRMDCGVCHESTARSEKSSDKNLPEEAVCAPCHKDKVRRIPADLGDSRCLYCHADWDPSGEKVPAEVHWADPAIRFSHRAHEQRMIVCAACHQGMEKDPPEGDHLPSETLCLACHNAQAPENKCTRCHSTDPSGRLASRVREQPLRPERGALDHTNHWLDRHGRESAFRKGDCDACHQQHTCDACHDGVMKPLETHPPNYEHLHAIDARRNPESCQRCHRFQSFCLDCHEKLAVAPGAQYLPPRVKIHPSGWETCAVGANHHSFQARRNLLACVSCHREEDCLKCHASGGQCGGNIRIHRHMSNGELSRIQKNNPRACVKCHENLK